MNNQFFVLFANCVPVKGNKRSVICDLHNHQLKLIPNDLYDILVNLTNKSVNEIKNDFNNEFDDIIDEYFNFLNENGFGFYTDEPQKFPKLNLHWKTPLSITNAILDINDESNHNFSKVFEELEVLGCKHLQMRFYNRTTIECLADVIGLLKKMDSSIISIELIVQDNNFTVESINTFLINYQRITSFVVYNSEKDLNIRPIRKSLGQFVFTKENIKNHKSCGVISSKYFAINIKNFTESQSFNSCLNKKISIDAQGDIKNCPSMIQSFGNIQNTTLQEALRHKDFKKYWTITKNEIDICRDCEFRYVCTDCRAYTEDPNSDYSKPLKCGYSPYTNEWSEWSTNPMKQETIKYYGLQNLVKNNG